MENNSENRKNTVGQSGSNNITTLTQERVTESDVIEFLSTRFRSVEVL